MASSKEYAYFIKGNKISLVEKDYTGNGSGLNYTYNAADGIDLPSGGGTWKSPLSAVADGIQIEYTHGGAIEYTSDAFFGSYAIFPFLSNNGHLGESAGVFSHATKGYWGIGTSSTVNWTTGNYSLSVGDYIVVSGFAPLNGLHRIQAFTDYIGGTNSAMILETKFPTDGSFNGSINYGSADTEPTAWTLYYDVKPLLDEDSEIQIPRYKAVAMSYYVKARLLEDMGKLKESEYFMAKFFKHLERHDDAKVWSLRQVMPGNHSIR
tara:strand:+ start:31 stop:825 length:795 start_codon:yes stop_codon:yes gene_type:complete